MSLTLEAMRAGVATRAATIAGWTESPYPYEQFRQTTNLDLSSTFAVGVPELQAEPDRQRATEGVLALADVRVAFAQKMKPKEKVASYGLGLEAGRALVKALLTDASPFPGERHPVFVGLTGGVIESGEWFLGEARFTVQFRLDLTS
jgi:hypothetical protein